MLERNKKEVRDIARGIFKNEGKEQIEKGFEFLSESFKGLKTSIEVQRHAMGEAIGALVMANKSLVSAIKDNTKANLETTTLTKESLHAMTEASKKQAQAIDPLIAILAESLSQPPEPQPKKPKKEKKKFFANKDKAV